MVSSKERELFFNRQIRRFCLWLYIILSVLSFERSSVLSKYWSLGGQQDGIQLLGLGAKHPETGPFSDRTLQLPEGTLPVPLLGSGPDSSCHVLLVLFTSATMC